MVLGPLVLTITAGLMAFAMHALFGPDLSPRRQQAADVFMTVFAVGSKAVLGGPFRLLRGEDAPSTPASPPTAPSDTAALPHSETKQITKE
jgi:hypothetical protein